MTPHRLLDRLMPRPAGAPLATTVPRRRRLSLDALEDRTLLGMVHGDEPQRRHRAVAHCGMPSLMPTPIRPTPGRTPSISLSGAPGRAYIALVQPLPAITRAVIIDGTSQPGYLGSATDRDRRHLGGRLPTDWCFRSAATPSWDWSSTTSTRRQATDTASFWTERRPNRGNLIEANFIGINATGTTPEAERGGHSALRFSLQHDRRLQWTPGAHRRQPHFRQHSERHFHRHSGQHRQCIEGNYIGTDVTGRDRRRQRLGWHFHGCSPADSPPSFPSGNFGHQPGSRSTTNTRPISVMSSGATGETGSISSGEPATRFKVPTSGSDRMA